MNANQQFSNLLQHWLTKRNLSAAELARRLGVNRSTVSRWQSGEILPDRDTARQIADLLVLGGTERRTFLLVWLGESEPMQDM
ncbi:MAG: helix-turn-helix transcriptional regulator [Roseiflexaceae bacterium]|nr:helix-turn-helix transcriptional regulator [Roseiflexaceae bacterium]